MNISWGYSPKTERYIPLGDFPVDRYLVIARQAIENLGWKLSHISKNGLIAYTPISFQSYSEEISIRIDSNFAIAKSECVGIQMWFNDYGKNSANIDRFFHEFEYVEFHLKDKWDESLAKFHEFVATQDENYFEKAPLTIKNKIKNVFYLAFPRKGYLVTPILLLLNIAYYLFIKVFAIGYAIYFTHYNVPDIFIDFGKYIGASSKDLILGGDFWRLISYQFVHWNILHLFFNMYALVYVGLMVEHKLGSKKYLTIYLLSGICGGLLSIVIHDKGYIAGASGSIFGLFGAFMALLLANTFEKNATKAMLISTVLVCAIMLLNGIGGRTDNTAHVGGLISGFLICWILIHERLANRGVKLIWRYAIVYLITLAVGISTYLLIPAYQSNKFYALEKEFKDNTAAYSKLSSLKNDMTTLTKLKLVRINGIEVWQRNMVIAYKMDELELDHKENIIRNDYKQITQKTLRYTELLYDECKDHDADRKKIIDSLMIEINSLKSVANQRGGRF